MRDKIALLDKAYKVSMELLLKECESDYDKCIIYSRIGETSTYIIRGNKYLDEFIQSRLDEGCRHEEIYFDEVYDCMLDWYGEEEANSVAKFWADHKLKSMALDW